MSFLHLLLPQLRARASSPLGPIRARAAFGWAIWRREDMRGPKAGGDTGIGFPLRSRVEAMQLGGKVEAVGHGTGRASGTEDAKRLQPPDASRSSCQMRASPFLPMALSGRSSANVMGDCLAAARPRKR
jgi:hypothetical protein